MSQVKPIMTCWLHTDNHFLHTTCFLRFRNPIKKMLKTFFCIFKITRSSKLHSPEILGTCHMLEFRDIHPYNQGVRSNLSNLLILVIIHFKASWYLSNVLFACRLQDSLILPRGYFFV